jgi:hypothetical protein
LSTIILGPWPEDEDEHLMQQMRYVGSLIRQDFMVREIASMIVCAFLMQEQNGHRAIHTLLKRSGFSDELIQEWSNNIDEGKSSIFTGVFVRPFPALQK